MTTEPSTVDKHEHKDQNPYIGPRAFAERDADRFFGRQREARDLLARVVSEQLLLFYAESGAGKSSLIHTRLIPGLRDRERFSVLPVGRVSGSTLTDKDAVDNIYAFNLMASLDQSGEDPSRLAHLSLSEFLAHLVGEMQVLADGRRTRRWIYRPDAVLPEPSSDQPAAANSPRFALIIDQFEEIISTYPDQWQHRAEFFKQINQAMQADPNLWVVLTLREDYVASLDPYRSLLEDKLQARFRMDRMGVAAALEAVKQPARQAGRPFAPDVAEALVRDLRQVRVAGQEATVSGQYVEPVQLQVVCYQLWERVSESRRQTASDGLPAEDQITQSDLETASDVNRSLEQFYADTLGAVIIDPDVAGAGVRERSLRTWFDKELITETGIRGTVYRNEADGHTGSLPNVAVDALTRRFLIRTELRGGGAWVELIHDRFVEPIRGSNMIWFRKHLSALQRQAALWHEQGRNSGLLLRDGALVEAETWAAGHSDEMTEHEDDFLAASRQAQDAVNHERRQSRLIRLLAIVAFVVMFVAIGAAILALVSRQREESAKIEAKENAQTAEENRQMAEENAQEAERNEQKARENERDAMDQRNEALANESQLLATLARQQFTEDPVTALHLSLEALPSSVNSRPYLPEAEARTIRGLNISLEREYQKVSEEPLTKERIGYRPSNTGKMQYAIGGDGLSLVEIVPRPLSGDGSYMISGPITFTADLPFVDVDRVVWNEDGAMLASYGSDEILRIWQDGSQIAETRPFTRSVSCIEWQPAGDGMVICHGNKLSLWSPLNGPPAPATTHIFSPTVSSAQWSADGQLIAAWDGGGVWISDLQAHDFITATEKVRSGRWSPEGENPYLVTVSDQGATIWDLPPDGSVPALAGIRPITTTVGGPLQEVVFWGEENQFITWGSKDKVRRFSRDGKQLQEYGPVGDEARVSGVQLSPDDSQVLIFLRDGPAELWPREYVSETEPIVLRGHSDSIETAAWHPQYPARPYIATAAPDGTVRIWHVPPHATGGRPIAVLRGHEDLGGSPDRIDIQAVDWVDHRHLVTVGEDGSLRLWQIFDDDFSSCINADDTDNPQRQFCRQIFGFDDWFDQARWLDDDTILAVDRDGTAGRITLSETAFVTRSALITDMQTIWSPDGAALFHFHRRKGEKPARFQDFSTGQEIYAPAGGVTGAFWFDQGLLVSRIQEDKGQPEAEPSMETVLLEPVSGEVRARFPITEAATNLTAAALYSESLLATVHDSRHLCLWRLDTIAEPQSVGSCPIDSVGRIAGAQWSPNGDHLLTWRSKLTQWDAATGNAIWQWPCEGDDIGARFFPHAALSPDGRQVAVAAGEAIYRLEITNAKTCEDIKVVKIPAHENTIQGVAWTTGAQWPHQSRQTDDERLVLLSWSGDGTATLWDWQNKAALARLDQDGPVGIAAISPDGSHVFTTMNAGDSPFGLRVWNTWLQDPDRIIELACDRITHDFSREQVQTLGIDDKHAMAALCAQ